MRLRNQLALTVLLLSLAQVAAVVPITLRNLRQLLETQETQRLNRVMLTADAVVKRRAADTRHAMEELAQSAELEAVSKEAVKVPPPPTLTTAAATLMVPRGLEVLSLLDPLGRTLSSGHLPARIGDLDETLFEVTKTEPDRVRTVLVELSDEAGLHRVPALVSARPVDYGDTRLWAVGGVLLTDSFAAELHRLTGARVEVSAGDATLISAGEPVSKGTVRQLDLDPATVRLYFSRSDVVATQGQVLFGLIAFASLGLLLTMVLGLYLSRRITRPLEALTDATRRIASGNLEVKVVETAAGEVKTLIDTFNRMTQDLKTTTDKLVASERIAAWQEVARRLAHEIKNPLTPIKMSLETLLAAGKQGHPKFEQLFLESAGAVLEEVERLRRTVDEFSQFARLPKPKLEPLSLTQLVQQLMQLYAPHGEPEVRYRLDAAPDVMVLGDRDQLTQVAVNLVKNAEEAMATTGGTVTVRVVRDGSQALLEVEDEGPGVPDSARARIFEPYVTSKAHGTGLGLAIAARIAEEHSGELKLTSPPGAGARFTLRLPGR